MLCSVPASPAESFVEISEIQPRYNQLFQNMCGIETDQHQQREKRHATYMQDAEEQQVTCRLKHLTRKPAVLHWLLMHFTLNNLPLLRNNSESRDRVKGEALGGRSPGFKCSQAEKG